MPPPAHDVVSPPPIAAVQTDVYVPRPAAVVTTGPANPRAELHLTLRSRIRQAVVLFLCVYLTFIVRNLIGGTGNDVRFQRNLLTATAASQLALVALSRSRLFDRRRVVRATEFANLALFWATQGVSQYASLADPAETTRHLGDGGADLQKQLGNTLILPWFALIAAYPVLVPNSVRRTVVIVGVTALAPVIVTLLAMSTNPDLTLPRCSMMFAQYAILGAVGVGIAAYAAAKTGELRREAFEARQFGQYRLTRKLGEGGMGELHLAEHRLLRRPSVIKLIRPDRATDPGMLDRFSREVRLLATLTHPNTVQVFDYGHTPDSTFYFVMEYLPGADLDAIVARDGPLPPGRAVHLARQICGGLREAHSVGLIHRDIKPSNIMVCHRGGLPDVAKLLDFGLVQGPAEPDAPGAERLTREGVVLGTPAYMSPEQAAGRPVDARSDLYSLGATLYFLLTGRPPFTGRAMEVIAAHLLKPPPPPTAFRSNLSADLCGVVMRCLAKDPADRYPSARDLDAALAACTCTADWDEDRAAEWWRKEYPVG